MILDSASLGNNLGKATHETTQDPSRAGPLKTRIPQEQDPSRAGLLESRTGGLLTDGPCSQTGGLLTDRGAAHRQEP